MGKASKPRVLPDELEVLIIGAGPHGLAMASRLLLGDEAMPDVIGPQESYVRKPSVVRAHLKKKRKLQPHQLAVVDSSGAWMKRWQNQFQALSIEFLRSNEMMHPDAFDHSTLSTWAHMNHRNDFFFLDDLPKDQAYCGPFVLPSNRMMLDFCKHLVRIGCLDDLLWQGHVKSMCHCESVMKVTIATTCETREVIAKHVIIARGPTWRRQWPAFYHNLETAALAKVRHAWDLFDNPDQIQGLRGKGVIIGGGLTSAHLCAQLAPRGRIDLLIRRDLRIKQYDLELSWMGTGRRTHRREYERTPLEQRAAINKGVRDGGSITPELYSKMSKLEDQGILEIHEFTEVVTASFDDCWTIVLSDDEVLSADYLICASGTSVDIFTDPLLADLQRTHPVEVLGGLPVLTENLQWGTAPVYVMGNIAALELGPDAVNMNGAVRGALRISSALASKGKAESAVKKSLSGSSTNMVPESMKVTQEWDEPTTPTASTMTSQGEGCGDHLCQNKDCGECSDDQFKPLLEFEFIDKLDNEMLAMLRELGWAPEHGSPVEYFDDDGDSLLHIAARQGRVEVMKMLLDMGANANACCQGECCCSPLMVACRWCNPDCARVLLDHGADINQMNYFGETAMDQVVSKAVGCDCNRTQVISLLHDRETIFGG